MVIKSIKKLQIIFIILFIIFIIFKLKQACIHHKESCDPDRHAVDCCNGYHCVSNENEDGNFHCGKTTFKLKRRNLFKETDK